MASGRLKSFRIAIERKKLRITFVAEIERMKGLNE
jgi:hypothetical protein